MSLDWWRVTLKETDAASGRDLANLLQYIHSVRPFSLIVVSGIEFGDLETESNEFRVFEAAQCIQLVKSYSQFDWADFFCCNSFKFHATTANISYPEMITKTIVTIRTIDGTDFEIFTKIKEIVEALQIQYPAIGITQGDLQDFDYPE